MIKLKSTEEIKRIRESGIILAGTLQELAKMAKEGIALVELDNFAREYILKRGARPAYLGYMDYPASLCTAVNNQIIHGIPGKRTLKQGDIVGLDLGVNLDGYYSDACITVAVGTISESRQRLIRVTKECLDLALAQVKPGNRISHISRAVYNHARQHGYDVVREYCGHGVGYAQHEDPQVPNYVSHGPNPRLKPGMVFAIEPMVNAGGASIRLLEDGWTVETLDGMDSAHFEHTVAVTREGAEILTLPG